MEKSEQGSALLESTPELAALRREIEEVDQRIVSLVARRCRLAEAAGERKRAAGLASVDPAQEAVVVRRAAVRARGEDLPEEEVRQLFWCLIALSRAVQQQSPGNAR
jgi:chorismate mutase/prephenate dehydratase